ncbi:MAG: hypothetical protein MZV63_54760 [Marinilabiliales bacterium]|nr:hypothetical protein [Marinilabiliales bacterium]
MKKVFGILLFAALIFTAQDGFAQSFKTGHINRDDIIMAMPEYDSAMKKLQCIRAGADQCPGTYAG